MFHSVREKLWFLARFQGLEAIRSHVAQSYWMRLPRQAGLRRRHRLRM